MLDYSYFKKNYELKDHDKAVLAFLKLKNKHLSSEDFTGWLSLASDTTLALDIISTCKNLKKHSKYLLVIGIGGSYLGSRAAISFLDDYYNESKVVYAGFNIDEDYLLDTYNFLKDKDFSINLISKSGTTTEPAIAFRFFYNLLKEKYPTNYNEHVVITTDSNSILAKYGIDNNIKTYYIPANVGGRYSVLTACGLLPICFNGHDILSLLNGAKEAFNKEFEIDSNSFTYALLRYNMYTYLNLKIEVIVGYNERLRYFFEWFKQLFAESEGKEHKGLYPSSLIFTTDLHSLGQFIQQGSPILFETILKISSNNKNLFIKEEENNFDNLNYLANYNIGDINNVALNATMLAHMDNACNILLNVERRDEFNLGYLFMFFEIACAISGFLLDINPFDQPGVEMYKKNMFAFLNKPGFSDVKKDLLKKFNLKDDF